MAESINEVMHLEEEWFSQAAKQTLKTLPDFINHIMNDYFHDYGTACHAVAACALAAAWAANDKEGLTGFQAGFVMWDFVKQWNNKGNKCGMRLVDYDKMLYPQYEDEFGKRISADVWHRIQAEAKKNLEEREYFVHPAVKAHWESIVKGEVPFGYKVSDKR